MGPTHLQSLLVSEIIDWRLFPTQTDASSVERDVFLSPGGKDCCVEHSGHAGWGGGRCRGAGERLGGFRRGVDGDVGRRFGDGRKRWIGGRGGGGGGFGG